MGSLYTEVWRNQTSVPRTHAPQRWLLIGAMFAGSVPEKKERCDRCTFVYNTDIRGEITQHQRKQ